jgi:hypothetical protein
MVQVLKYISKNILALFSSPSHWEGERGEGVGYIKPSRRLSPNGRGRPTMRLTIVFFVLTATAQATSISEYHKHLAQAVTALDSLAQADENETGAAYEARRSETILSVRQLLPVNETIEAQAGTFTADNFWLQQELDKYKSASSAESAELRQGIIERLQAIAERLKETETPAGSEDKAEASKKLAEIMQRPEYARKVKQESAIGRLWRQLVKWLQDLFPKPKPIAPGTATVFSKVAQVFVIVLAVAVLIFVAKLFCRACCTVAARGGK